jgi:hypothetical protein
VDPSIALEYGYAAVGTQPVPAACIEELRVDDVAGESVGGCKVPHSHIPAIDFDACDPYRREVGNPECPIGSDDDGLKPLSFSPSATVSKRRTCPC